MEFEILPPLSKEIGGFYIHYETVFMVGVVTGLLALCFWLLTRKLRGPYEKPGRAQALAELLVEAFDGLVEASMGAKRGRKYLPFIGTLFFFILFCNMIALIPWVQVVELAYHAVGSIVGVEKWAGHSIYAEKGLHFFGFHLPRPEEPTKNLNVPLGLAVLFLIIVHGSAIKIKGISEYLWEYGSPPIVLWGRKFPNVPMIPLNVVGELGKAVSLPFRLFGNIFGGSVILILAFTAAAPYLLFFLPLGLNLFFGVFVGTVQAFVFTMLAMTYIVVAVGDEE